MLILLGIVSIVVGTLIGTVGVGGILLIPALTLFAQLTTRASMATALFSFIFTGLAGTWLYQSRGSINWRITLPVCAGAVCFGYFGALANSYTNPTVLNLILSGIIIFAGIYTLRPWGGRGEFDFRGDNRLHLAMLLVIGAAVGFGSGLTGVGGPVLSVPMMVIIGFAPLTAIATSQVIQIAAAASGTIGNIAHGSIDFGVASWVTVMELAGVMIGVRMAHAAKAQQLKKLVAVMCFIVGTVLFVRHAGVMDRHWETLAAYSRALF